mmetsp:Transcript_115583/g.331823  ORF Transcript_115583/g.331823 Transcript_115583/m.331823 type:complete len:285 (-) Transcript_115583:434-1288(-)
MPLVVIAAAQQAAAAAVLADARPAPEPMRKEQPVLVKVGSQCSVTSTCSNVDDLDSSPCAASTPQAGDVSPHSAPWSDADLPSSPCEDSKPPTAQDQERNSYGGRRPHADCASTSVEQDDMIAKKLAVMGQDGIVAALGRILSHFASMGCKPQRPTMFHSRAPPPISIQDYLARLAQYYACSDACLILALVYIDRVVKFQPQVVVNVMNVHRLLAVAVMLAAKFHDDVYYSNEYYGRVAGLTVTEMNKLEEAFLKMLRWKLLVQPGEYEMIVDHVLRAAGVSTH